VGEGRREKGEEKKSASINLAREIRENLSCLCSLCGQELVRETFPVEVAFRKNVTSIGCRQPFTLVDFLSSLTLDVAGNETSTALRTPQS
jgi:hypothetical protein